MNERIDHEHGALRLEVEAVQKSAWAKIHGQDATRKYSVAEVKRIVYSFDNVLSSILGRDKKEPSDAQVEAALIAHLGYDPAPAGFPFRDGEKEQMRAALRAAWGQST